MRRGFFALMIVAALVLAGGAARAGFKDLLKKSLKSPTPQSGTQQGGRPAQGGNRTEQLIFGGLKTLQSLQPIGYKEEYAIGGAVALEAVARFGGLDEDPALEKYLAKVGNAVASLSDRPDIPYFFGVLNAEDPNAFACPGGYVFVSRGLLKLVKNEAQLAGILGHEIIHIAHKHALDAIRRSKVLGSVSEVTLTALDQDPKMFDSIVKETVSVILERGYDRSKEYEADAYGADFAFRVGYNPNEYESFLKALAGAIGNQKVTLNSTHPNTMDRVARLAETLRKPEYRDAASLKVLADRYARTMASVKL
ncbi:MAG: M48 family metalloprotease [Pseudomonadota bacterium]